MAIKDLQIGQGKVDIEVVVSEKGEPRTFNKFGREGRVCSAKVRDDTGEITFTLWNEDIDKVDVSDRIHIINGYISEWQGEPQLTTGKFGKLEILEKGTAVPKAQKPEESPKGAAADQDEDFESNEELDVEEESIDDLYDEEEN